MRDASMERFRQIVTALERRLADVADEALADAVRSHIDARDLVRRTEREEPIDVPAELVRWHHRRDTPGYPYFLSIALKHDQTAIDEAVEVLGASDPTRNHVILAMRVANLANTERVDAEAGAVAAKVLQRSLSAYASSLLAESLVDACVDLAKLAPAEAERYRNEAARWQVEVEAEQALTVEAWMQGSHFFAVFWHHCRMGARWGLRIDGGLGQVDRRVRGVATQQMSELRTWRANGASIPCPLGSWDGLPVVDGEYLVIGRLLHVAAPMGSPWDELRHAYNESACDALADLYDALGTLEALPSATKDLFGQYRRRFDRATILGPDVETAL
jgi:hypothetical protein